MCQFFSLCSDGKAKLLYFDWELRQQILTKKLRYESADSHTSIADYFLFKAEKEDELNKHEYDPLTGIFKVDQLNTTDDSVEVEKLCRALDFRKIIKPLSIKPFVNPFRDRQCVKVTKGDILLLKKWASVGTSVGASVGASVRDLVGASVGDSVGASVWASVWDSVGTSVGDSVGASVWTSVGDSVWASVWDSVGASVWDSVWAYYSTFFDITYKIDVSPAVKLWERGLVTSFDGEVWRLHGKDGKIVYEWRKL